MLIATLPLLPAGAQVTGVIFWASFPLFAAVFIATLLASWACWRSGPDSKAYQVFTTAEAITWCGANAALIAISGSANSLYWLGLYSLVLVTATTVHRHATLRIILVFSLGGVLSYFLWLQQWSDAMLCFVFSLTILWFQHLSTLTGWTAERERARAELLAEHAACVQVAQERSRIARDLHDGVAAELTSVLWQAQCLDPDDEAQIETLVDQVRVCIAEVRNAVNRTEIRAMTLTELAEECHRICRTLIGPKLLLHFESCLDQPDLLLSAPTCMHVIKMVQEGVRNALAHAHASQLSVVLLSESKSEFEISIADDGIGVDSELPLERGGCANLWQRAQLLGGSAHWTAPPLGEPS